MCANLYDAIAVLVDCLNQGSGIWREEDGPVNGSLTATIGIYSLSLRSFSISVLWRVFVILVQLIFSQSLMITLPIRALFIPSKPRSVLREL